MKQIIIGVDPHKLSATIEVVDQHERLLGSGRFATDKAGYAAMLGYVAQWSRPTRAVEGSNRAGRSLAQRLVAVGHHVVDVPAKLAARVRLLDTGHGRKTDAHDAHAVAAAAVRAKELRVLAENPELESLRMVIDRRDALTCQRVQTVNRLHRLLAELIPGTAKRGITALQAKAKLASVRPRDLAGKTRRRIAADELADLIAIETKIKTLTKDLNAMVEASGSSLTTLPGVGTIVAARVLAEVGDVTRFADRNRFASWTGTAPLEASSGEQVRHRLSRAGNRRMNHMLHRSSTCLVVSAVPKANPLRDDVAFIDGGPGAARGRATGRGRQAGSAPRGRDGEVPRIISGPACRPAWTSTPCPGAGTTTGSYARTQDCSSGPLGPRGQGAPPGRDSVEP